MPHTGSLNTSTSCSPSFCSPVFARLDVRFPHLHDLPLLRRRTRHTRVFNFGNHPPKEQEDRNTGQHSAFGVSLAPLSFYTKDITVPAATGGTQDLTINPIRATVPSDNCTDPVGECT